MQIHELNNYNGALGNGSYIAIDNGTDTGKLSTQQLLADTEAEINDIDASLNARIDNIIAGGSAPSAAEVTDARFGENGFVYPSLGAAIRGQIADLNSDLDNSEVFNRVNLTTDDFKQGWYGASTGAYDAAHNNAICLKDLISNTAVKIGCNIAYKMRLQAWDGKVHTSGYYKGIWNGSAFTTTNPNYFRTAFDLSYFRKNYPTYTYEIALFKADGTSAVDTTDGSKVYYDFAEMKLLKPLPQIAEHLNMFNINADFKFQTRLGAESSSSYGIDKANNELSMDITYGNTSVYIVDPEQELKAGTYTLLCHVEEHTGNIVAVNIGDNDPPTSYVLKTDRTGTTDVGNGVTSGWVRFIKTLAADTPCRFQIQPPNSDYGNLTISQIMLFKGDGVPDYSTYDESISAIDKVAREAIKSIDTNTYNYNNIGERINLKSQGFNIDAMGYSLPNPATYGKTARQDFDIYDGVLFQLMSDNFVVLVDIDTGTILGNYSIISGHGNACQFAKYKDNPTDDYPPLYCFDYSSNKVYKNKVTDSSATLEATYILSGVNGYRFSGGYDTDNNLIVSINYALNSSTDPTDNYMIFSVWDLNDLTDNGDGTYTPALIKSREIPFVPVVQGCTIFKNRLFVISGYYPTYGFPVKIYVFDYDGICTSLIEDFPSSILQSEGEGIAFCKESNNYECYFATYDLYKLEFE